MTLASAAMTQQPGRGRRVAVEPNPVVPIARTDNRSGEVRRACACGGGCPKCRNAQPVQAKLTVGAPDDQYEQEADRVADRVMRMPAPDIQRQPEQEEDEDLLRTKPLDGAASAPIRRQEEDDELVQAKPAPGQIPAVSGDLGARIDGFKGGGHPLSAGERTFFEPRFGRGFGDVRLHTDGAAAETAHALNAKAFTTGRHVVFGAGQYAPNSEDGRRLLAHELTHVVQQSTGTNAGFGGSSDRTIQRFTEPQCRQSNCQAAGRCDIVQSDFTRAEGYVQDALNAMQAAPLAGSTNQAIAWYFHRDADTDDGAIARRLDLIKTVLLLSDTAGDFECMAVGAPECPSDVLAFVNTNTPPDTEELDTIHLCDIHFKTSDQTRAETLIHEAAHLVGMSVSTDDVYKHQLRFRSLVSSLALLNADSYALFASAISTGSIGGSVMFTQGLGGGAVFGGPGETGWAASVFLDTTVQHPLLHVFNPTLRVSGTMVGVPRPGEAERSVDRSILAAVLPGIRIEDPRPSGAAFRFSLFGGPSVSFRTENTESAGITTAVGAQVGEGLGFRWRMLDLGVGASFMYDPGATAGSRNLVQVGGAIAINFEGDEP